MTVRIERLGPGDGERWRCIRLRALAEAPYAFSTTHAMVARWSADRWETQVVELATFVAVVDGSDVGVARGATPGNREVRELLSLWVAPTARRQGIGARLIESVAAWASASGATELALDVAMANAPAIALYERAGFVRVEGGATGERALDEVRLVRSLATSSRANASRAQDAPSDQLVLQRVRNRLIEYLELASAFEAQQAYQSSTSVSVSNEIVNLWEDWYAGDPSSLCEPVFTPEERSALAAFHVVWSRVSEATPNPLPPLAVTQLLPEWGRLRQAASAALKVLAARGKLPEDIEV